MRYVILAAAVLMQCCIGGLYAWSEFVPALTASHGLSTAETQFIFGVLIAVFTISMVVAGRWMDRLGPAWTAGIGGLFFAAGYQVAAASGADVRLLLLGIGVLVGIGTGFCYVCPLTLCVMWFPRWKGLVTGIAVAGFGGGAVVMAYLGGALLDHDLDVLSVFGRIGWLYGALILLAAIPLRFPAGNTIRRPPIAFRVLTRDRMFQGLCLGMFAGTFAGLLVIGNLKPLFLSQGLSDRVATAAISVFAAGNACGRIVWGWVVDRFGARTVTLSLGFLAASLLLSFLLADRPAGAILLSALIGIGFGACFTVYAARTASRYGIDRLGAVYPLIFLAYGLSGLVGPWAGGRIYDATGSYNGGILIGTVVILLGAIGSAWLRRARDAIQPSPV